MGRDIRTLIWTALVAVAPLALGSLALALFGDVRWQQLPFHSAIEAAGGVAAGVLALLLLGRRGDDKDRFATFLALALVAMGVLDLFHGFVGPGPAFVWLHSLATALGGLLAAAAWLPGVDLRRAGAGLAAAALAVLCSLVGGLSIGMPAWLPDMVNDGRFTATAVGLNLVGGVGFVAAGAGFLLEHRRQATATGLLFGLLCLLFGVAGLIFQRSSLWDLDWWLWHMLRAIAYGIALWQVARLYGRSQQELEEKHQLELALQKIREQQQALAERDWVREQQLALADLMRIEGDSATVAQRALTFLARTLALPVGCMYSVDDDGHLGLIATFAGPAAGSARAGFSAGEGLPGQVASSGQAQLLHPVPQGYLKVSSGTGGATPSHLFVLPLQVRGEVLGVLEVASFAALAERHERLLDHACEALAAGLASARFQARQPQIVAADQATTA